MLNIVALRYRLKALDKRVRRWLRLTLLRPHEAPEPLTVGDLRDVRRILLVRPNFRMGNALIALPMIAAFGERFPQARIDVLVTDKTRTLFDHEPVGHCFVLSRGALLRPWRLLALLWRLRAAHHDLVVHVTPGSFSGHACAAALRPRYTMGVGSTDRRRYNVAVPPRRAHAYDQPLAFARTLGVVGRDRPALRLDEGERANALAVLRDFEATDAAGHAGVPFVALFVGGHLDKRWAPGAWAELCRRLERDGIRFLAFRGPEERALGADLERQLAACRHGTLIHPRPLREFAAMLAHAHVLVTPDSGPMHLAVALDRPTVALLRQPVSRRYAPRGPQDRTLWMPDAAAVHQAVRDQWFGSAVSMQPVQPVDGDARPVAEA